MLGVPIIGRKGLYLDRDEKKFVKLSPLPKTPGLTMMACWGKSRLFFLHPIF